MYKVIKKKNLFNGIRSIFLSSHLSFAKVYFLSFLFVLFLHLKFIPGDFPVSVASTRKTADFSGRASFHFVEESVS